MFESKLLPRPVILNFPKSPLIKSTDSSSPSQDSDSLGQEWGQDSPF